MQWLQRYLHNLRLPWLFLLSGVLMLVSWLVPDPLPLVDELLFMVMTIILGSWRGKRADRDDKP